MQSDVNHGIEVSVGLATGRDHSVMTGLEGVGDPVASLSLDKVRSTITSGCQLGLVGLVSLGMALCELLVRLAAVEGRILLLEGHSCRTRVLIPVWIGSFHPDEELLGFLEQGPL